MQSRMLQRHEFLELIVHEDARTNAGSREAMIKVFTILCMVLLLGGASPMRAMSGSLLCGCPDTHAVSAALAKLRKYDWRETSLAQLQAVWPTHLDGLDCDASGCTSVWSKDRIIANQC